MGLCCSVVILLCWEVNCCLSFIRFFASALSVLFPTYKFEYPYGVFSLSSIRNNQVNTQGIFCLWLHTHCSWSKNIFITHLFLSILNLRYIAEPFNHPFQSRKIVYHNIITICTWSVMFPAFCAFTVKWGTLISNTLKHVNTIKCPSY